MLDNIKDYFINYTPEDFVTYKIKCEKDTTNRENLALVTSMGNLYSPIRNRVAVNLKTTKYYKPSRIYWDILLKQKNVDFYLSTKQDSVDLIMGKAKTVWNRCKFSESADLIQIDGESNKCLVGEFVLKTFNYKSLNTDLNNQYPLTNMLTIIKDIRPTEFVRVNVGIEPMSRINWMDIAKEEQDMNKKGKIVNNTTNFKEKLFKWGMDGITTGTDLFIEFQLLKLESIFGIFLGDLDLVKEKKEPKTTGTRVIGDEVVVEGRAKSNYKANAQAFKTKITIIAKGETSERTRMLLLATASAYNDLADDNELSLNILEGKQAEKSLRDIANVSNMGSNKCILSDKEIAKLIQLPQRTLQQELKLNVVEARETDVPKELQGGDIEVGIADTPGNTKKVQVTLPNDKDSLCKKNIYISGEGGGKTTQITRLIKAYIKAGMSNFVIDHNENCEMTDEITEKIPKKSYVLYDVYNSNCSFNFSEVQKLIKPNTPPTEKLEYASMIAKQVIMFVNSITDTETGNLTARMKRYIYSASMLVFTNEKTTIGDVFDVLRDFETRNKYIELALESGLFEEKDDEIKDMIELHKRDNKGKITGETREDLITGVVNRIIEVKSHPRLKAMLNRAYSDEDDLDKYIQNGISIFIKIPQTKFPDANTRDVLASFYFSRLWLCMQIRQNNRDSKICHMVIDEVKALPMFTDCIETYITEFRRHRLAMTVTAHNLGQFGKLLTQMLSCGCNFFLLNNVEKNNVLSLKEEIQPFTLEDVQNMPPFHALALIWYQNKYWKGIVKLNK
ncbi:MAG: hypothetical protein ACRC1P_09915 [Cellulosilyticaceae bacterium]